MSTVKTKRKSYGKECQALGCKNYSCINKNVSYHYFPTDDNAKQQWIIALKRKDYKPAKYAVVCSDHFTNDCFISNDETFGDNKRKRLHGNAVPSIFSDLPLYYQENKPKRKTKNSTEPQSKIQRITAAFNVSDSDVKICDDAEDAQITLSSCDECKILHSKLNTYIKRYKNLQRRYSRLSKKLQAFTKSRKSVDLLTQAVKKKITP